MTFSFLFFVSLSNPTLTRQILTFSSFNRFLIVQSEFRIQSSLRRIRINRFASILLSLSFNPSSNERLRKNQPFLACLFRESDILFETLERNFIANGGLETWKSSGEKSGALEGTILSILGKSMQTLWGHYPVGKLYRQKL